MKADQLWKTVLSDLEVSLSRGNFMTWIFPTRLVKIQQINGRRQIAEIACKSAYHRQFIEERYLGQIKDALDRITKRKNEIVFVIRDFSAEEPLTTVDGPLFQKETPSLELQYQEAFLRARLREDFTFETFAVSSSNEMAHAAARAVSKSPGEAYNPLFLYGGVGVGKTHLTQAIGHAVLRQDPDSALIYCTGEEFTNEIINAIRRKETYPFKKKYRSAKLLLIDDAQFIAGKTAVQEEFFHTFNAILQEKGQIVLVSDQLPHEIVGLEDRLRSRFEGGLTIDIQQPNFELRTAILLIKAKNLDVELPIELAKLIAANIESARRLEGFLARLSTEAKLRNQEISEALVRGLIGTVNENEVSSIPPVRPKEVLKAVAGHYNIAMSALEGPRRSKSLVGPRHLAMYMLRSYHHLPLEEIGNLLGGRDHTTVMHAVEKITKTLSESEQLRVELVSIKKKIYG
jgi:chromosomal replication initiator protein